MQVVPFPSRQARAHYRHELCHLAYVVLDAGNGGIIRNLNREGVAVQAVSPLHPQQRVRVRFELTLPRIRVETYGEVSWARSSGQCGIRFVNLPAGAGQRIDEWIFSNLIDVAARHAASLDSIFGKDRQNAGNEGSIHSVGILQSAEATASIPFDSLETSHEGEPDDSFAAQSWLSRPLSGRTLAWLIDGLAMFAAWLLFALIFLTVNQGLPGWPWALAAAACAFACATGAYWIIFAAFGGSTPGARLAESASRYEHEREED